DRQGVVKLALTIPPSGPSVSAVAWRINGAGGALIASGTIQTGDPNATASVQTSGRAGSGYVVSLSAMASDGSACTGTSLPFNVAVGGTTTVDVQLVCGGGTPMQGNGSVVVTSQVVAGDNCPVLRDWSVSPTTTSPLGVPINVHVSATDADSADLLTYAWS